MLSVSRACPLAKARAIPQPGPRADDGETPSSGKNAAIPIWIRSQNFAIVLRPLATQKSLAILSDGRKGSIERVLTVLSQRFV